MNPWLDFVVTVVIRLICGFVLGAVASYIFGFRVYMRGLANGDFPVERLLIWGGIGAVICMFTTPRDSLPWIKG